MDTSAHDSKLRSGARKFFNALLAFEGQELHYSKLEALLRALAQDAEVALYVDPADEEFDAIHDGEHQGWLKPLPNQLAGQRVGRIEVRDHPFFRELIAEELPHVQAAITHEIERRLSDAKKTGAQANALLEQMNHPKAPKPMEQQLHANAQQEKARRRKQPAERKTLKLEVRKVGSIQPTTLPRG